MRSLINGYQSTCLLVAASRLDLFDRLADGPKPLAVLAAETRTPLDALRRLVRALAAHDLVVHAADDVHLTPSGLVLLRADGGLGGLLDLVRDEYLSVWCSLGEAMSGGPPTFERAHGLSPWEHRRKNPALDAAFNRLTRSPQLVAAAGILDACDLSGYRRVVDVGGGHGFFLASVLARHRSMTGVLFDQPHVVEGAQAALAKAGVIGRCERVGGSFFEAIPPGGDLYVLQYVLHDWDDERAAAILRQCRAAMHPHSTLLVLEKLLPGDTGPVPPALAMHDLHMMAMFGSRERTLTEYEAFARSAGLDPVGCTRLPEHVPDVMTMRPSGEARGAPAC